MSGIACLFVLHSQSSPSPVTSRLRAVTAAATFVAHTWAEVATHATRREAATVVVACQGADRQPVGSPSAHPGQA